MNSRSSMNASISLLNAFLLFGICQPLEERLAVHHLLPVKDSAMTPIMSVQALGISGSGIFLPAAGQFLHRGLAHGAVIGLGQALSHCRVSGSCFQPRAGSRIAAWRTKACSSDWARALRMGKVSGSCFQPRASSRTAAWRTRRSHRTGRGF